MSEQLVVCADCLDVAEDYIDDGCVIVTDPPYNIGYHYATYRDKIPEDEYYSQLSRLVRLASGAAFIMYPEMLHRLTLAIGVVPQKVCSWIYNANTERQHRDVAYYGIKPDFSLYRQPYKNMNDKRVIALYERTGGARSYDWFPHSQVKNKNKDDAGTGIIHPCQMPVEVMKYVVGIIPRGYRVVDPFCGSGTTGVACAELDIDFVGIEADQQYAMLAQARIDAVNNGRDTDL